MYVDQAGLVLGGSISTSASGVLGLKVCATMLCSIMTVLTLILPQKVKSKRSTEQEDRYTQGVLSVGFS